MRKHNKNSCDWIAGSHAQRDAYGQMSGPSPNMTIRKNKPEHDSNKNKSGNNREST